MRTLVRKLCLFGAIQLAILLVLIGLYRVDRTSYLSASVRKEARLRATKAEATPRLILVGGSAVALGYHSPMLEEATGRTVVNMGMQGSLGLTIKLTEVLPDIKAGDWVVLALEYQHYGGKMREGLTQWGWLEQDWSRWRFLAPADAKAVLDAGHLYLRNIGTTVLRERLLGTRPNTRPPYDPASFNQQGDVVGHRDMPAPGFGARQFNPAGFKDDALADATARLRAFAASSRQRGAEVFIYFPPIPRSRAEAIRDRLEQIEAYLLENANIPILNGATDNFWPDDRFFDTLYHLTYRGEAENTAILLEALRESSVPSTGL